MLVVRVFINNTKIDEIKLVNTGCKKGEKYLYRFLEPKTLNYLEIYHDRNKNWSYLVEKALKMYNKEIGESI